MPTSTLTTQLRSLHLSSLSQNAQPLFRFILTYLKNGSQHVSLIRPDGYMQHARYHTGPSLPRINTSMHRSPSEESIIVTKEEQKEEQGTVDSRTTRKRSLSLSTEQDEQPAETSVAKRYAEQDAEQVQIRESKAQVEKRIFGLMQRKRADIDKSNCAEFIAPPENKEDPYSARTHPAELNRTIQMKLDVVDNGGEALARLVASPSTTSSKAGSTTSSPWMVPRGGVEERFRNIEQHLNIQYGKWAVVASSHPLTYLVLLASAVPLDVYERLKVLEDKIIQLERDHPTWAAIHFNQPGRTFPPPPPPTMVKKSMRGDVTVVHGHPLACTLPADEAPPTSSS
ncbi:hypothetical protein SYNPS1DRAFT_31333 [Syncephalis pseudoplumigaleata]|uniref:Uncharacterized protein n=1 Tax=Syncephalis pseudoplumigaleata TaxID=1712513 RepID=A0A4P9YSX2_9FUNG|nr:hypothetical protein SYNPS1DRAFT_31333 [Syncephalis pseudoplumigaleata]|eukprot:RKP22977.1 hypothetical protein SYNPS1DRAFT_31333 [Syncephalis pseudoplumigaleata]